MKIEDAIFVLQTQPTAEPNVVNALILALRTIELLEMQVAVQAEAIQQLRAKTSGRESQ